MITKPTKTRTYPHIKDVSKTLPPIEASRVAEALGAEATGSMLDFGGSPLSLFQVRQELMRRLQSSGGRPCLSGISGRKKIPLNDQQWEELEEIASQVASPGFSPSAGQIASVMLSLALRTLRSNRDAKEHNTAGPSGGGD